MNEYGEWLQSLAVSADGHVADIIAHAVETLPTDQQGATSLLTACQMVIWQKETNKEQVEEDLVQLRKLRDQLLT